MYRESNQTTSSRRIYSVQELNEAIQSALRDAFPGSVWVRGEVQRLPADAARRKHVYFELHDTSGSGAANFQIPVALLEWDRRTFQLGQYLDGSDPDFQLRNKLEVCLECRVDFYPPFGKLSLKVIGIDKHFTLGRLEALRRKVLAFLKRENLLELNAGRPWPLLPLHVGLITAAGSAAERDFRTGLVTSPYRFVVEMISCKMQGERTEQQVTAALERLPGQGVDVIVLTRGGGSRGDLSWFDQQGIAVAIARCPVPVVTAIGHEIDRSIADIVASQSCKTPTAAAELLITKVEEVDRRLEAASEALSRACGERLENAGQRLALASALAGPVERRLQVATISLQGRAARLEGRVARRVGNLAEVLGRQRSRLGAIAVRALTLGISAHAARSERLVSAARRRSLLATNQLRRLMPRLVPERLLAGWPRHARRMERCQGSCRRLAGARLASARRRLADLAGKSRLLDPRRLLARGYTLTLDVAGRPLKSALAVVVGDTLQTQFQDGSVQSTVTETAGGAGGSKGEKGGGEEERSRQETLFR